MAILGLGTDIAKIERFIASINQSDALAKRVLTEAEWQLFKAHSQGARYLAKRFCAKEAAAKALGTGIASGVTFHDFEIINDPAGKPCLSLTGKAASIAQQIGVEHCHLTIADEREFAVATVIYEGKSLR